MNEAEEQRLLDTLTAIAGNTAAIAATLVDEARNWHEHFRHIEAGLGLIADGVAPPVNEPPSQKPLPPYDLRFAVLHDSALLDEIKGRVDKLEAAQDPDRG